MIGLNDRQLFLKLILVSYKIQSRVWRDNVCYDPRSMLIPNAKRRTMKSIKGCNERQKPSNPWLNLILTRFKLTCGPMVFFLENYYSIIVLHKIRAARV